MVTACGSMFALSSPGPVMFVCVILGAPMAWIMPIAVRFYVGRMGILGGL